MNFAWPYLLITLLIPLVLLAVYIRILRRRKKLAISYGSLSLMKEATPSAAPWKRHVPAALLLLGLVALSIGSARPRAFVQVPLSRTSIILALDVSLSMCSTDVAPNRLAVAQDAARTFVESRDDGTQIGIVAFGGTAELVVPPTNDTSELVLAIENFTTSLGTGIGNATLRSIDAIAEINPDVDRATLDLSGTVDRGAIEAEDEYVPDIVVLLTDGANSQGVEPLVAAQQAFDRRVRVFTIGFGGDEIAEMVCAPSQIGPGSFAPGFGFNNGRPDLGDITLDDLRPFLVIDEPTLREVADLTGGQYYRAADAQQLIDVFNQLPSQIVLQERETEISVFFALAAAALVALAFALSNRWNRR
ncbi:MAG: Ca-activated chloride channel family protein [Verrucomicrobiales bacterium]|jgi:Ca-activated chloride channel family protein